MIRTLSMSGGIAALGLFLLSAPPAAAADAAKEIATAAAHAGMAAASGDMKMVQGHLQHVINCLVGPAAGDYDAAQANPCKDMGAGAIPDASPEKQMALESALRMAKDGAKEPDMAKAKEKAAAVQAALGKSSM